MRGLRNLIATTGLLVMALLPMVAAVSPEAAPPARDRALPVAIAQPLAAVDGLPMVTVGGKGFAMLPEPGMLVLVGAALLGLAAIVRRTT
jgi:hypothetical protein